MRVDLLREPKPSWSLSGSALSLIISLWIIFVGGISPDEMIVGTAVLLLSAAFLYQVWRTETLTLNLELKDLVQGWRIPWYVLSGCYEIIVVLLKDLFSAKKADSLYRVTGFAASNSDPRLVARRVLAVFFTTMAPNFIVIGIDDQKNRMLFHQLKRSSVPRMAKSLGAQSEGLHL